MYGDPDHPDRVTRTISGPLYTVEDHALIAAMRTYEATLCPGCGVEKQVAWHSDMDGWFDSGEDAGVVCHSCTARRGRQVSYAASSHSRDLVAKPLPPFDPAVTVTRPDPPKKP